MARMNGQKRKAVVPMHDELTKGTLISIMKQAGITREELENLV